MDTKDLEEWIANTAGVVTTVEEITPAQASAWLDAKVNVKNRGLSQKLVDKYARIMIDGGWHVTNQGLGFGSDGTLYDGQHRLAAVVQAGVTVKMSVTRGLPPECRTAIDGGKPRRLHDRLSMFDDVPYAKPTVAWANAQYRMLYGVEASLNPDDVLDWRSANLADVEWGVDVMGRVKGRRQQELMCAPVLGALIFAHRRHPDEVDRVADRLVTGAELVEGEPCFVLREHLLEVGVSKDRSEARWTSLKVLRATQLDVLGAKKIGRLQRGEEGLRYFVASHHAGTLLSPPRMRGRPNAVAGETKATALVRALRSARSLQTIVDALLAEGMGVEGTVAWCARHQDHIPFLASIIPAELASRVERMAAYRSKKVGLE